MDSSVVGGVASLVAGGDLKVFTVGFQEAAYDEREQAAVNCANMKNFAKSNLTHLIRLVPQESTFPLLERLASSYGEPYADASLLPTSFLCAFAREEGCSFALCGDCADEFFGGYERYLAMRYLAAADKVLPSFCKKALVASGRVLLSGTGGERKLAARGRRFLEGMAKSGKERYFSMITHMTEADKLSVAGPLFRDAGVSPTLENFDPSGLLDRGTAIDPRERPNEFDLTHYLPDDCLMKAERAARSASLDLRAPFLHDKILDFALRLPYSFKEKGGYRKRILGETFADLLPKGLVHRKKRGFGVPLAAFFRGGWKEDTARTLLEGTLMKKGYFDPSGVKKLLDEHVQRGKDHSYLIFSLLMAELSLR
ncbi:MAG: hypothetical protein J6331_02380 [Lentisphaeria bacterium]|nr:hypothetical protein [Lentisphaeria bacterium]